LQEKLNNLYAKEGVKDRNASKGEFFMLECCPVPSVLIECGFLSSEKDEKLLLSSAWQNQICQTIASGVLAYFSKESL
jgi:N-acetylmuramoyl-L-alanine amidase